MSILKIRPWTLFALLGYNHISAECGFGITMICFTMPPDVSQFHKICLNKFTYKYELNSLVIVKARRSKQI